MFLIFGHLHIKEYLQNYLYPVEFLDVLKVSVFELYRLRTHTLTESQ